MTGITSTSSNATTPTTSLTPALPMDRDWLKKLILEHSSNPNHGKGLVVAPMVDQSDYAFRLLCRNYGANVTYTPMINAGLLVRSSTYQEKFLPRAHHANDRPVIAQLCGHDPLLLEQAARLLLPYVDGIDLNCGCPQGIAKRGFYGAFLLEEEDVLLKCVRHLVSTIPKPISVKVRVLPQGHDASMKLYHKLVHECGIHLLTIHGRTRHQLQMKTGAADWTIVKRAVQELGHVIPIFANGNIGSRDDVQACFDATGADGVMSSEALLEYPALFWHEPRIGRVRLAKEYLQLARHHPPELGNQGSGIKCLKAHIHRFLHADLEQSSMQSFQDHVLRQRVAQASDWQVLWDTVMTIEQKQLQEAHVVEHEELSWYMRHRTTVTDARGNPMTALELKTLSDQGVNKLASGYGYNYDDDDDAEDDQEDPEEMGHSFFTPHGGGGHDIDGDY